jgi:N-acetylmuramoyl-L-alanine amidase
MAKGTDLLSLGSRHVGEAYENVLVPKNNANWHGPWDCAEFTSWVVYQASGQLYGCVNDQARPEVADAYTGAWWDDAHSLGRIISIEEGIGTVGAFLLRRPPAAGLMGHIAISDGLGHTVEARGHAYGVCRASASGRAWDIAVLVPTIDYTVGNGHHVPPTRIFRIGAPTGVDADVRTIQQRLSELGCDPGDVDGVYGPMTAAAVTAFQRRFGVTPDGEVGPVTWSLLFS